VITYAYDSLGQLKTLASSEGTIHYEYSYADDGLPIAVKDLIKGTSTLKRYDSSRRLIQETLGSGLSIEYEYDRLGRPVKVVYPDRSSVEYGYVGILLKEVAREGKHSYRHTYAAYNLLGLPSSMELIQKGGAVRIDCGLSGKIEAITHPAWREQLAKGNYDAQGNLLKIAIKDRAGTQEIHYCYDALRQINAETGVISHRYTLDSHYNRVAKDGASEKVNPLNQVTHTAEWDYLYDDNGNLVQKRNKESKVAYTYDALDRLVALESSKERVCYTYDELNRRLTRTVYHKAKKEWVAGKTIRYLYQGQNEVGAVDWEGNVFQMRVLGVGKGAEIGSAVACELNGKVYAPIHDHNGNVAALIDSEGNAAETYRYTAYGEEIIFNEQGRIIDRSALGNPWRFSSKRIDEESGWIFFGRRHYDPKLGRWTTADPLGYEGGPNLYAYVLNAPLTHIDLYGLQGQEAGHLGHTANIFRQTLEGLCNFVGGFVQKIGWGISFLSYQMLPQLVKDPFGMLGELLTRGTLRHYVPSFKEQHSMACNSFGGKYANGHVVMYIPGQMTTYEDAFEQACLISRTHGGIEVHFVCNGTHGIVTDTGETVCLKMGIPTNVVNAAVEMVDVVNREYGAATPKTLYGFSQGGQIIDSLKSCMSREELQAISVVTLGSAKMVVRGDFASAINFVSWKDFVPFIADLPGIIRGLFTRDCQIVFMGSSELPFLGHAFMAEGYQKIISEFGQHHEYTYGPVLY
jgi:RHS repeat-associated protein